MNLDRVFLELPPRNSYACTQNTKWGVKQRNKEQTVKRYVLSMSKLLQKHIRASLSRTFFDGSDLEKENLRESLAWHAHCWEGDEVDPSAAAAGVKKALAPRSEVIAFDRVKAAWSSFDEYFALNASIKRVFRHSRGRLKSGSVHTIPAKLVAGFHPPELKN